MLSPITRYYCPASTQDDDDDDDDAANEPYHLLSIVPPLLKMKFGYMMKTLLLDWTLGPDAVSGERFFHFCLCSSQALWAE